MLGKFLIFRAGEVAFLSSSFRLVKSPACSSHLREDTGISEESGAIHKTEKLFTGQSQPGCSTQLDFMEVW